MSLYINKSYYYLSASSSMKRLSATFLSSNSIANTTRTISSTLLQSNNNNDNNKDQMKPKTAVVLMNMGGPHDQQEVHPFLLRLFSDHDIIPLPFQKILGPWIARRRTPKIQDQYMQIGGGSPIRQWTDKQGEKLTEILDKISPDTAPHKHYIAFRYASPLTEDTIQQMKKDGVLDAVALTMYPQYSCSTTGSSLNELHRQLKIHDPDQQINWSVIDRWPTHKGLVDAFVKKIGETLATYPEKDRDQVVLLFSAHSLPMTVVNRGDPYPAEVAATVHAVMEKLGHSNAYRLIWQSQVGPQPWLGPKTETTIEEYGKKGLKNLLVVPIAFVSDHIETLFEVDLEYGELAKEHGVDGFKRAESLNDDPVFIQGLSDLVLEHLKKNNRASSKQLFLRCPSCVNPKCEETKSFFSPRK